MPTKKKPLRDLPTPQERLEQFTGGVMTRVFQTID